MLITAFLHIRPEGHREPRNEVGSLSPAEHLVGFEWGTFRYFLQCLNPLGHSPLKLKIAMKVVPENQDLSIEMTINYWGYVNSPTH